MKHNSQPADTDFVGQLVDRAFGRTETLQPRLPSLFEPVTETAAVDNIVAVDGVRNNITPKTEIDGPPPTTARSRDDDSTHRIPIRERAMDEPPNREPKGTEPVREAPDVSPRADRAGHANADVPEPPAIRKKVGAVFHRDVSVTTTKHPSPSATREAAIRNDTRVPMALDLALPVHPIRVEKLPLVIPASPPRRSNEGARHADAGTSPPVVRVTIGRVEVRAAATTPSRRASREAAGPQPMRLDEYLKRQVETR